jgi:hypothetical protein
VRRALSLLALIKENDVNAQYALGLVAALIIGALAGYEFGVHHGSFGPQNSTQNATQNASGTEQAPTAGADYSSSTQRPPEVRAAARAMHEACAADSASLCKDVATDHGGLQKCLRSHQDQLSAGCKTAWQNLKAARLASRNGVGSPPTSDAAPAQ